MRFIKLSARCLKSPRRLLQTASFSLGTFPWWPDTSCLEPHTLTSAHTSPLMSLTCKERLHLTLCDLLKGRLCVHVDINIHVRVCRGAEASPALSWLKPMHWQWARLFPVHYRIKLPLTKQHPFLLRCKNSPCEPLCVLISQTECFDQTSFGISAIP